MNELLRRMNDWWSKSSMPAKAGLISATALVLVALFIMGQRLTAERYAPLFTKLEPQDAGAIVEELQSQGVSYQLADQGQTILVPEARVYDLRLQLANKDVMPNAGLGFELFDQNQLGMTDKQRQINYMRALSEELRRTIVQMEEVEQARVHLSLPEPSVFITEERLASASIALKLKPLARITPGQVKGIVSLVAGSVEGLAPENITVIDLKGNVLSDAIDLEGGFALGEEALKSQELTRSLERDLEQRLQRMLERILGPNKAVAMVSAQLNFDRKEETKTEYGDAVVRSEQTSKETQASGPVAGGSTDGNTGSYYELQNQGPYGKEETVTNFEINQTQTTTVTAPGDIENLSVAVAVDTSSATLEADKLKDLVSAAVGEAGLSGAIATTVEVLPMAFDTSYQDQLADSFTDEETQAVKDKQLRRYLTWGAVGLASLLLLAASFVWFMVRRRRNRAFEQLELEGQSVIQQELVAQQLAAAKEMSPSEKLRQKKFNEVKTFAGSKPEETVQLLRAWLVDEE